MIDYVPLYSARGNVYAIVNLQLASRLFPISPDAGQTANTLLTNGLAFAEAILRQLPAGAGLDRQGRHPVDGIVLGPFRHHGGSFEALIVNTDGSLPSGVATDLQTLPATLTTPA